MKRIPKQLWFSLSLSESSWVITTRKKVYFQYLRQVRDANQNMMLGIGFRAERSPLDAKRFWWGYLERHLTRPNVLVARDSHYQGIFDAVNVALLGKDLVSFGKLCEQFSLGEHCSDLTERVAASQPPSHIAMLRDTLGGEPM